MLFVLVVDDGVGAEAVLPSAGASDVELAGAQWLTGSGGWRSGCQGCGCLGAVVGWLGWWVGWGGGSVGLGSGSAGSGGCPWRVVLVGGLGGWLRRFAHRVRYSWIIPGSSRCFFRTMNFGLFTKAVEAPKTKKVTAKSARYSLILVPGSLG